MIRQFFVQPKKQFFFLLDLVAICIESCAITKLDTNDHFSNFMIVNSFPSFTLGITSLMSRRRSVSFAAKDFETLKRSYGCKELPGTVLFSFAKDGLQSKEDPFAQKLNIPIPIKLEEKGPFLHLHALQ